MSVLVLSEAVWEKDGKFGPWARSDLVGIEFDGCSVSIESTRDNAATRL
jgi:hypothetical protein